MNDFSGGDGGYEPVSYTHLDVYKRQVLRRGVVAARPHGIEHQLALARVTAGDGLRCV